MNAKENGFGLGKAMQRLSLHAQGALGRRLLFNLRLGVVARVRFSRVVLLSQLQTFGGVQRCSSDDAVWSVSRPGHLSAMTTSLSSRAHSDGL